MKSYKQQVAELAKATGLKIYTDSEVIEVSGYDARIHNDAGGHLDLIAFDDFETEPQAWRAALSAAKYMIRLENQYAPDHCECGFIRKH